MLLHTMDSWDGTPLTPSEATERIRQFVAQFGSQALLLAAHLAPAEQFKPDLVALARLNFLPAPYKFDASLDAHILFGPLTYYLGNDIYEVDKNIRWHLIAALKQWQRQVTPFEVNTRVKQASHLIRQYAARVEKYESTDDIDKDYLNRIKWVALAYEDSTLAAEHLAIHLATAADAISQSGNQSSHVLSFTKLRPLLELPLSSFTHILDSSHLIESLLLKDEAKANSYASYLPDQPLTFGQASLPSAKTLLQRYRFSQGFSAASKGGQQYADADNSTAQEEDFSEQETYANDIVPDINDTSTAGDQSTVATKPLAQIDDETFIDSQLVEQWFSAIKSGNQHLIKAVLKDDPNIVNIADSHGYSALHYIAENNTVDLLPLFLQRENINLSCRDNNNNTPLIVASSFGHTEIVKQLFTTQKKALTVAPLHETNNQKNNCFDMTIINGHLEQMNWFLEAGLNPNDVNIKGESPLSIAAKAGRFALVKSLLFYGAKINYISTNGTGLLAIAAQGGNPNILSFFIELGLSVNARNLEGHTPLMSAAYYRQPAALEFLLSQGAEYRAYSADTSTALLFAVQGGQLENVKRLIVLYPNISEALEEEIPKDWNALRLAALRGYPDIVRYLHSLGGKLQESSHNGWNLLHLCCQGFSLEEHQEQSDFPSCVDYLISQGIDINTANQYGDTPLHIAARQNQVDIIEQLVQYPEIEINKINSEELTPFLLAIKLKQVEAIYAFAHIPNNDFSAQDKSKAQALRIAVDTHCEKTLAAVLTIAKIDRNHYENSIEDLALWHAASLKHVNMFSMLCQDRFVSLTHKDTYGNQLLHILAKQGKKELVSILLAQQVDVNCVNNNWQTPLAIALDESHYDSVAVLLERGAHTIHYPEAAEHSPLRHLLLTDKPFSQKETTFNVLIDYGAQLHEQDYLGQNLLHTAIERDDEDAIQFLIGKNIDIHARDRQGFTLLHTCINRSRSTEKRLSTILLLIKHGIEINSRDNHGLTPLHLAVKQGQDKIAQELLRLGADVTLTTNAGWNALHFAALADTLSIAEIVLKNEPDLLNQVTDAPILSPLQICSEYGSKEVCQHLLQHQPNIDYYSEDNLPAVFIASKNGFHDIVHSLVNAGAKTTFSKEDENIVTLDMFNDEREALENQLPPQAITEEQNKRLSTQTESEQQTTTASKKQNQTTSSEIQRNNTVKHRSFTREDKTAHQGNERIEQVSDAAFLHTLYAHHDFDIADSTVDKPWFTTTHNERAKFLEQVNPIDGKYRVPPNHTQVLYQTLPFYKDVCLIRVRNQHWENPRLCIFYLVDTTTQNIFRLNGTSPPIHEVNAKAPVRLDESNILDYLRFFCFFVRGDEGPFYTLEHISDPNLAAMDQSHKDFIASNIQAIIYKDRNEQGHYQTECTVAYSNALFRAQFSIQPSGMVEMLNDEPIAGDLATILDVPIA